jgi:hypothetical protein
MIAVAARRSLALLLFAALGVLCGCGKSSVNQALESDANGYLCRGCKTKFYVDREIFADFCPNCKSPGIDQVVGFVCAADSHTTVGPRGRGSMRCEKCGQATSGLSIPRAAELQAWGAAKKTRKEVCGS